MQIEHYAFLHLLRNQSLLKAEKIKFCKTSLRLVATYGAECWTYIKSKEF